MNDVKGFADTPGEGKQPSILIIDDEEAIRRLLGRILTGKGYICKTAGSAQEARELMSDSDFGIVLCDVNLPGESGIEFIQDILSKKKDIGVLMVSAMDDPQLAETALELGAYGYIVKPFKANEILINVKNAWRRLKLEVENRAHRKKLEEMVEERTARLKETLTKLQQSMEGIVQAMAITVETRDPYTAGHQRRVAELAVAIGGEIGLPEDEIYGIHMAGQVHDLGKIAVPAEILSKPTKLTDIEFALIKTHPEVGYDILKGIAFPWPIADMVVQHHERIDGSGYPGGLSNSEILTGSKIIGVADVVEAMASHRPYRPALGIDKALEEISTNPNGIYDPTVVEACVRLFREKRFQFGNK